MTPYPYYRHQWVITDPDTGQAFRADFAVAVNLDRLTADQIDAATDAAELDAIPADVLAESVSLASLLADGLRWRAWMATPYQSGSTRGDAVTAPDMVRCAGCELAEGIARWVDIRDAVVVPAWDVAGDRRTYVLACPECAEGCDR